MALRRTLFQMIREICERDGLSAEDIARMCGTSRPRAYSLFARRIELFNSETLVDMLWRLGVDVEIAVTGRHQYLRRTFARPRPGWKPPPNARY
jgi:predicted XRE-type DNA-binding protein